METVFATSTEMKNHFGKYLEMVEEGKEIIVTRNGKQVGRLIPEMEHTVWLTDMITGIIQGDYDPNRVREASLRQKYEIAD